MLCVAMEMETHKSKDKIRQICGLQFILEIFQKSFGMILLAFILAHIYLLFPLVKCANLEENPFGQHCESQLGLFYADFSGGGDEGGMLKMRRTLACRLSPVLQQMPMHLLLQNSRAILNCSKLPFQTLYQANVQKANSFRLGCFDPTVGNGTGLTILSANFGTDSPPKMVVFTRRQKPLWTLKDLPEPEYKFKRFPSLDLRLPGDFSILLDVKEIF